MLSARDSIQGGRYTQVKSETMEKDIQTNGNSKKAWVAILISDKKNFSQHVLNMEKSYILSQSQNLN